MTAVEKPELAVNRGEQTVAGALNGFISHAATGFVGGACLDIATAYFNVGGYSLLADSLDRATGVRLLLGAEPMPPESRRRALRSGSATDEGAKQDLICALDACVAHLYGLDEDDLAVVYDTFSETVDYSARHAAVLSHFRRLTA
ncbi:MAG: hypothetical protein OXN79_05295 [bacterium]|nr:hypothetical protein [bacterium]